jgi:hypothetical protein
LTKAGSRGYSLDSGKPGALQGGGFVFLENVRRGVLIDQLGGNGEWGSG